MNTYLFLDTETTGFKRSGSLIQRKQGRVCQIAMILADESGKTLAEYQSLIRPNDWDLNGATHNYFGISYRDCEAHGVHQKAMLAVYHELATACNQIIAHNSDFDKGMIDVEQAYFNNRYEKNKNLIKPWFCTMKKNTHITSTGKWPKLDFALKHYTGKTLENAHDAMADTRACKDIFFAMKNRKVN